MRIQIIITLIMLTFPGIVSGQSITADFDMSVNQGCTPLQVSFVNQSEGDNLNYEWDFGNGNTSVLENPGAVYSQAGNYDVRLIAYNNEHADTILIKNAVSAYSSSQANITTNGNTEGCAPLSTEFSASGSDLSDGDTYRWDFGTGTIYEGKNISMNFDDPGYYDVLLTIINEHGCISSTYAENHIEVFPAEDFDFSASKTSFCNLPAEVTFSPDDNLPEGSEILWDFGDGNSSTETTPTHTYEDFGNYDVSATVINANNCESTVNHTNIIQISPVLADFSPADTVFCNQTEIQFSNHSEAFSHAEWDFGDGATSNEVNPQHEYSTAGSYEVNLQVWNDDGCQQSISHTIEIEQVEAGFTTSESVLCGLPAFVEYQSESENAVSFQWRTDKGITSSQEDLIMLYTDSDMNPGSDFQRTLTDTLIVSGALGCTDTAIQQSVEINMPRAWVTPNNLPAYANDVRGCVPLSIEFNNESVYDNPTDSIVAVHWNFGDGNTSEEFNPSHTWTEPGEYLTRMTVKTAGGCSSSFEILVEAGTPQTADFSYNIPDTICASDYISLFDESSDESLIDQWIWSFSDGGSSVTPNPQYHFTDTGYMDVALMVGYNGCMSEPAGMNDITYAKGPVADFSRSFDCDTPLRWHFSADVTDADGWYWKMGDGTIGFHNQEEVSYTYSEAGNYTVELVAHNVDNECDYTARKTIKPRKLEAKISTDTTYGCPGLTINADGEESQFAIPAEYGEKWGKYHWIIDKGAVDSVSSDAIEHTFSERGEHSMSLVVTDRNGCRDTASQIIKIYQPVAKTNIDNITGCAPLNVSFAAQVSSDTTIDNTIWNFDDGMQSQELITEHTYTEGGSFTPGLAITDVLGCSTSISAQQPVVTNNPSADFSSANTKLCTGESTRFIPENQDSSASYYWSFGNGDTSEEMSPEMVFNEAGNYHVNLKVITNGGCVNQQTRNNYINVQNYPEIDFIADETESSCYPFSVHFDVNSTQELASFDWDFGNESHGASNENPDHTYHSPGIYDVSLIAATSNGCSDTLIREEYIHVGGPSADINMPELACPENEFQAYAGNTNDVTNIIWDMGNGDIIHGDSIEYTYTAPGEYSPVVILQADNNNTCDKSFELNIEVPDFYAEFTDVPEICQGQPVEFQNESSLAGQYHWTFGRDGESLETNPSWNFSQSGEYDIQLVARGDFGETRCIDTAISTIRVNPIPHAEFTWSVQEPHECELPKEVHFNNQTRGGTVFHWSTNSNYFSKESFSGNTNPSYTFETSGTHTVELVSINAYNCSDTVKHDIKINPAPNPDFSIDNASGCDPLTTEFLPEIKNPQDDALETTHWDFGDNRFSDSQNPSHTYHAGTYSVSLAIETENGCRDTLIKDSIIKVHPTPTADFVYETANRKEDPEKYGEVQFINHSGGGTSPLSVSWDFGDGFTTEEASPMHRYSSNQNYLGEAYRASLFVTDARGCSDSLSKAVQIDYFNGLYVPNAIIPESSQGEQGIFKPKGKSLTSYRLLIYNRHGKLIFESDQLDPHDGSPQESWNGKFQGQIVEKGVYVWKIEATFSDGSEWYYETAGGKQTNTGTVLVIR